MSDDRNKFKKGMKVRAILTGAGCSTEEIETILKVTKKGVWLDNGDGNDPSGPFDPVTGRQDYGVFGFSRRIEPLAAIRALSAATKGAEDE